LRDMPIADDDESKNFQTILHKSSSACLSGFFKGFLLQKFFEIVPSLPTFALEITQFVR
jgi:hypothetical protein